MLNTHSFESAHESLELFKGDALLHAPGVKYSYTTHGFTVVAAALEAILSPHGDLFDRPALLPEQNPPKSAVDKVATKWDNLFKGLFAFLGLRDTLLDEPNRLIALRAR